jgi:hypothetical protein
MKKGKKTVKVVYLITSDPASTGARMASPSSAIWPSAQAPTAMR